MTAELSTVELRVIETVVQRNDGHRYGLLHYFAITPINHSQFSFAALHGRPDCRSDDFTGLAGTQVCFYTWVQGRQTADQKTL